MTVGVKRGEKGSFRVFAQWRSKQALWKARKSVPIIRRSKYKGLGAKNKSFIFQENKIKKQLFFFLNIKIVFKEWAKRRGVVFKDREGGRGHDARVFESGMNYFSGPFIRPLIHSPICLDIRQRECFIYFFFRYENVVQAIYIWNYKVPKYQKKNTILPHKLTYLQGVRTQPQT